MKRALFIVPALAVLLGLILSVQALAGKIQYQYDDAGRLTRVEYANGTTIRYGYDAMGNRLKETVTATSATAGKASCPDDSEPDEETAAFRPGHGKP